MNCVRPTDDPTAKHPNKVLNLLKTLVAQGAIHYSSKVGRFIQEGFYGIEDLKICILTATAIHKTENDELGSASDGYKYTIIDRDTQGYQFYICGKIILSQDNQRLYFFITAHKAD